MRLTQIQKRTLITEGWNDPRLTLLETKYIVPFVQDIERYIVEAQLTPDQINQLFTNVEQGASAAGGNRTLVGKGKDAASFISKKIDELGAQLKKAGPVANADAKFAELKSKIGATDSKVVKGIQAVSDWAKENPGKASIAVGILTVAASMAAGPLAGAITGFISRASKDLLQGKDLSTAAGGAVKTAALGAVVGAIGDAMAFDAEPPEVEGGDAEVSSNVGSDDTSNSDVADSMPATVEEYKRAYATAILEQRIEQFGGTVTPEMVDKIAENIKINGEYPTNFKANFDGTFVRGSIYLTPEEAQAYSKIVDSNGGGMEGHFSKEANTWLEDNVDGYKAQQDAAAAADAAADAELKAKYDAMSPEEQKAYDDKRSQEPIYTSGFDEYTPPGTPKYKESINFKNIQIETIIEWCDETPAVILTEGPLDAIKKGASAVGGALKKGAAAVGAKAAKVGKNITTKVTADKLNSAWKKAGSPTDSDEIANILRQQGVSDQVLAPIYKTMGAKLPAAPVAADPNQPAKGQPTQSAKGQPTAGASNTTQSAKGQPTAGASNTTQTAKGQSAAGASNTTQTAKGQSAAGTADFKSLQKTVANLNAQDAATLVTYIDSLSAKTTSATQGQADTTAAPTAPAQGQAAANPTPTPKASNLNSYFQNFSKEMQGAGDKKQKIALAKELVNIIADRGGEGSEAAVSILRKVGGDLDNNFKQAAMNALKNGQRLLKQSVYFEITKMLREHNLSWSDLGIRVHLLEGTNKVFGISFK